MICPNCKIEIPKIHDGSYKCPQCIFVTFENLTEIKNLFAYVSVDVNGNEGIVAYKDQRLGAIMPMMGGSTVLMNGFKDEARRMAKDSKMKIKLLRFTNREEVEVFA